MVSIGNRGLAIHRSRQKCPRHRISTLRDSTSLTSPPEPAQSVQPSPAPDWQRNWAQTGTVCLTPLSKRGNEWMTDHSTIANLAPIAYLRSTLSNGLVNRQYGSSPRTSETRLADLGDRFR